MEQLNTRQMTRRQLQRLLLAAPAPLALALAAGTLHGTVLAQDPATPETNGTSSGILAPTPQCVDDDDLEITTEQSAGPFFAPDSPERTSLLEEGVTGNRLVLAGYVYSTDCQPLAGALLDFWQADDAGVYDNEGYRLRGHQFSDDDGRYELTTILPGLYPGRTRHIHVRVQAPGGPLLTSQLYFPDQPANDTDSIFDDRLLVEFDAETGQGVAYFTFVVPSS